MTNVQEKSDFIWGQMKETIEKLNMKKITTEHAKSVSSLLKQANNVLVFQLDVAKFKTSPDRKEVDTAIKDVGL